jgi:hypothetical protein
LKWQNSRIGKNGKIVELVKMAKNTKMVGSVKMAKMVKMVYMAKLHLDLVDHKAAN